MPRIALGVDQCTTRVAWINGSVCLQKIFVGILADLGSTGRTDDALGDGLSNSEGIANRKNDVTDIERVDVGNFHLGQVVESNLEYSNISIRVGAYHFSRCGTAVIQHNGDSFCFRYYMMVGDDIATRVEDDAGARAASWFCLGQVRQVLAKYLLQLFAFAVLDRHFNNTFYLQTDHRGCGQIYSTSETIAIITGDGYL